MNGSKITNSLASIFGILDFTDMKTIIDVQVVSRAFYDRLVPLYFEHCRKDRKGFKLYIKSEMNLNLVKISD